MVEGNGVRNHFIQEGFYFRGISDSIRLWAERGEWTPEKWFLTPFPPADTISP
jgi:hypothetical protein